MFARTLSVAIVLSCGLLVMQIAFSQRHAAAQCTYQQCGETWSGDLLDGISRTLCNAGCAVTSATDVVCGLGADGLSRPSDLNNWLKLPANGGFTSGGDIVWSGVSAYVNAHVAQYGYGRSIAPPKYYGPNVAAVDSALASGKFVILGVPRGGRNPGHWVAAWNIEGSTWGIADPAASVYSLPSFYFTDKYRNTFSQAKVYELQGGSMSRLGLTVHSPVEVVLTDPEGRRLGFDPRTETVYNEIPDAFYGEDGTIADDEGQLLVQGVKTAWLNAPIDGEYTIEAIGTDTGSYSIDGEAYDENGGPSKILGPSGTTVPNQVDTAIIDYSSEPLAVGGIAEYAELQPRAASTSGGSSAPNAFAFTGLAVSATVLLAAGGWYARKRWLT